MISVFSLSSLACEAPECSSSGQEEAPAADQAGGSSSAVPFGNHVISLCLLPGLHFSICSCPWENLCVLKQAVQSNKDFFMEVVPYNAGLQPLVFSWISSDFHHQGITGSCWSFLMDGCQQQEFKIPEKITDCSLNVYKSFSFFTSYSLYKLQQLPKHFQT